MSLNSQTINYGPLKNELASKWETRSSIGLHFNSLDGIRGIAILMVVVFHTFYVNPESGEVAHILGQLILTGYMGVPVFFVLSGFLISYPFFRLRWSNGHFWNLPGYSRRRLGKIIPPFYLSIIIFSFVYFFRSGDCSYWLVGGLWALGIPNIHFIPKSGLFNATYWSLIVEVQFYILLPLLFLAYRRLKFSSTVLCMFGSLIIIPQLTRTLSWIDVKSATDSDYNFFLMCRFPNALDYFAWGILFAGLLVWMQSSGRDLRKYSLWGYAGVGLLAFSVSLKALIGAKLILHSFPQRWIYELFHLLPSLATFLMLFFVLDSRNFGSRFFAQSWLRFIGLVSYEWFLFHQPIVILFGNAFGQTHGNIILYLLKTVMPLVLTFGFSVLVYRYFSLPLMNRIRGKMP